jgi:hypothetical protein
MSDDRRATNPAFKEEANMAATGRVLVRAVLAACIGSAMKWYDSQKRPAGRHLAAFAMRCGPETYQDDITSVETGAGVLESPTTARA